MNNIYKSPSLTWVAGSKNVFQLDFLPVRGPRGGRLAIEKMEIEAALNITTAAGNSIAGADMAGFINLLRIWDTIGNRYYLTGPHLRVVAHQDMAGAVPDDPATHAASTSQTDTFKFFVNFRQPFHGKRGWDFAMPVEDLKGGGLEITCPTATQIQQTGGPCTINSGTYTVYVHCREEWDVEMHSRRCVEYQTQTLVSAWQINVGGSLLESMTVYKDAASGGTAVSTFTDLTIEPLALVQMPRDVLVQGYLSRFTGLKTSQDPFVTGKALPVLFPRLDMKHSDLVAFPGSLLVRATSTFATPFDVIVTRIAPKDARMIAETYRNNGIDPRQPPKIKTEGKTATDPRLWGDTGVYMPAKVGRRGIG